MAIEVREIHIRAVVNESGERTAVSMDRVSGNTRGIPENGESSDELISQCVEKVMEILREKNER